MDTGEYPDDLGGLTTPTAESEKGLMPEIPRDPWKRDCVYRLDGDGFVLFSMGRDGRADTEDDVSVR